MKKTKNTLFKHSVVFAALSTAIYQPHSVAAEEESANEGIEVIQVTATRRAASVQDIPVNITALDGDIMADQNIGELTDVARWVPGLTIQDQGNRSRSPIIVRGLNTDSSGPGADGGTVAVYVGESPLTVDLKILDVQRVEVLIGPQGTLYGAGSLGGAIRYIPNKPVLDETSGRVYGGVNSVNKGGTGHEVGFIVNMPLISDELGFRAAFQQQKNAGYIDYNYLVKESGISLPDPDWSDASQVSANIKQSADANYDDTSTAKFMLRWMPTDKVDAVLSYTYQQQEVGGRSIVHHNALAPDHALTDIVGKYESAYRVEEPMDKTTDLLALEITADLGFAELTSATSLSSFESLGQRDQTDLLIRLAYSYEEFPAFSSYTREDAENESFVQEVRLVSTGESDLSWIVGGYYSKFDSFNTSEEFTPGFDEYAINEWGVDGNLRPDSLEYYSVGDVELVESAIFGELSYQVTDALTTTFGFRHYQYEINSMSSYDLPLYNSVFGGAASDAIDLDGNREFQDAKNDGTLFKVNVSYQVNSDLLTYATISEGFRIGGSNGVAACTPEDIANPGQVLCALPHEVDFRPDTTVNYEIGMKSTLFNNRLHLNGAAFYIKWEDAQIGGATQNGQIPIIANASGGAESSGLELSARAMLSNELSLFGSYSLAKAKLAGDAPYLFGVVDDPARQAWKDGEKGDRLPGAPEHQFALGAKYSTEILDDKMLDVNFGYTYQSELITRVGLKNDGQTIDGYGLANLSASLSDEAWSVTLYINNLLDEYAVTSVRRSQADIGSAKFDADIANRTDLQRNFGYFVSTPRTVGVKFDYKFESF
ncbi:TonB-dependent receptor [Psychrosphaera sp. B3R10]|uniref:TonB-dependent receptor n=1 Tax=unclassified Psychrosphaera TaxID=2641570 RepID=UPI001C0970B5|nr:MULTISPECIES: TonB-dependent receptor [unclassified Psychrosphaera]MBU2881406.1 TonB-dependent receptor [Psychrosphaera sp. I2R16]MBU2989582.1 TonB-dependent receptor [Psychrosphaera sp. B3R10]